MRVAVAGLVLEAHYREWKVGLEGRVYGIVP